MGGGPSTPSASATGAENRKTAQYNTELSFVDQYTPDGNFVYSKIQDGDGEDVPPRYRLDTTLSDTGKAKQTGLDNIQLSLLGMGENQLGRVNDAMGSSFDWSAIPEVGGRDKATENAMKYLTYGYDDRYANQQSQLENQLAAQGIRPGSNAYSQALNDFNLSKNKAYETAGLQAYNQGINELSTSSQLRNQAIQEQAYARSLPLNELSALISGTQVSMPQFTGVSTAQASQQPYYQSQGNNWTSDLLGLGGSLGSAAILGKFLK